MLFSTFQDILYSFRTHPDEKSFSSSFSKKIILFPMEEAKKFQEIEIVIQKV